MGTNTRRKLKATMSIFIMVSMSMIALTVLIPFNVAAASVTGTVTEAGTGTPIENVEVLAYQDANNQYFTNLTDVNGDYKLDIVESGDYTLVFRKSDYNGSKNTFTYNNVTGNVIDMVLESDTTDPVITLATADVVSAISENNPSNLDFTVVEDWFRFIEIQINQVINETGPETTVRELKVFTNYEFMQMPGRPYEDVILTEDGPGTNSTTAVFFGRSTLVTIGDGTDTWETVYEKDADSAVLFGYYENTTTGPNANVSVMHFNLSTGILERLLIVNTTSMAFTDGDITDNTGKIQVVEQRAIYNWTDGGRSGLSVNATPLISITSLLPLTYYGTMPSGDYIMGVMAVDMGNHANFTSLNLTVDNDPPVADAGLNISVKQGEGFMFNGSASTDNMGIVNYTWLFNDGVQSVTVYGWNGTSSIDEIGLYEINMTATDVGGWTDFDMTYINVTDGIGPIADAGENISAAQGEVFTFNANMTTDNFDLFDDLNFTWTFNDTVQNVTLYDWNATHSLSEIGTYNVTLVVTDLAGNPSAQDMVWVNITDGEDPVADAGTDITTKQNEEITFNGTLSRDNTGIVNYTWEFAENAIDQTLDGPEPTYTFAHMGEYNVTLTVKDDADHTASDIVQVMVLDGEAPTANAGLNITGEVNETLSFDGSASEDNVGIVACTWDFGDDSTDVGILVTHVYLDIGTYTVTLTCTDAEGNEGTDTSTVTILPMNHPPIITAIGKQTAKVGQLFSLTVPATDEDSDDLNYTILSGPDGMTINPVTGQILWTPANNLGGQTIDVKIEVRDEKAAVNTTFQIEVGLSEIIVTVGPIKDQDGKKVKGATVTIFRGIDTYQADSEGVDGTYIFSLPGDIAGEPVTVKVTKDGYKDRTFSGTISDAGVFSPTDGKYPRLESDEQGEDYTFLVIVIIVLVVLALVLVTMRKPIDGDDEIGEEDEEGDDEEE